MSNASKKYLGALFLKNYLKVPYIYHKMCVNLSNITGSMYILYIFRKRIGEILSTDDNFKKEYIILIYSRSVFDPLCDIFGAMWYAFILYGSQLWTVC